MSQATIDKLVEHINSGGKIILGFSGRRFIGQRIAKFYGLQNESNDQPITVVRESSYEEWLAEFPGEDPLAIWAGEFTKERAERDGIYFYEVTSD